MDLLLVDTLMHSYTRPALSGIFIACMQILIQYTSSGHQKSACEFHFDCNLKWILIQLTSFIRIRYRRESGEGIERERGTMESINGFAWG